MLQPFRAVDRAKPVAFGPRVVFVNLRPPPFDHLFLDRDRTGRGRVDHHLQARVIVFAADRLGQLEDSDEHRRHHLRMRHPVLLDKRERLFRVEVLHDDRGAANPMYRHRELQRRRVIKRRWRQVDHLGRSLVEAGQQHADRIRRAQRLSAQPMLHALGLTCRARRVEHRRAFGLVGNRSRPLRANRVLPGFIVRDRAVHHVALDGARNHPSRVHLGRDVGHCMRCDENFRAGVIYDVGGFLRRQA